jgi:hypothetical protein
MLLFFLRAIQNTYMQCNHHAEFLNLNLVVRKLTGGLEKVNFFILTMTDTTFFFCRAATHRGSWSPHSRGF